MDQKRLRIIFVRHAEYDGKTGRLTELGKQSINPVVEMLKNKHGVQVDKIFTSPRPMAIEHARILSEKFGLDLDDEFEILGVLDDQKGKGEFLRGGEFGSCNRPQTELLSDEWRTVLCVTDSITAAGESTALKPWRWPVFLSNSAALLMEFKGDNWSEAKAFTHTEVDPKLG